MASKRMSLVEGMQRDKEDIDPVAAENFIKHGNAQPKSVPDPENPRDPRMTMYATSLPPVPRPEPEKPSREDSRPAVMTPGLISVNVRVRPEIATALQTASLQRQLQGVEPSSKREIVEEALGPWLKKNGYL